MKEQEIRSTLAAMEKNLTARIEKLKENAVKLTDFAELVKKDGDIEIWTKAFRAALEKATCLVVPAREQPYFIDAPVRIPSHRLILAEGATVQLIKDCKTLMFRNVHTQDGTHAPIPGTDADCEIAFIGGRYGESNTERLGYGKSGMYDENRSFYGVSTLFFFNNMEGLMIKDVTFFHTAGFSVQTGDIADAVFENILFDGCFADGLHLNGNSKNLLVRNIEGQVGDDLVALNMYDWQNSSVNFGATDCVLCENLNMYASSRYKALRIEPGTYRYDDFSTVDCALTNAIFSHVTGVMTYKLYFQTPPYCIGKEPEWGEVGSLDNLYFDHITVDLQEPIDKFCHVLQHDTVRGHFAAFEFGAKAGHISLSDIDLVLHLEDWPLSHLVTVGPKSAPYFDGREVFDPYLSSYVEDLELNNITVNGKKAETIDGLVYVTEFDDVNHDGRSTGKGELHRLTLNGKEQKL